MRFGLRLKQAFYIFLVAVFISSIITVFAAVNQKKSIQHEFLAKGYSLSHLLSATLVSPLYELKVDQIDRLLSHVLDEVDIKRTFVLDQESYILADGTEENLYSDELIHDVIPSVPKGNIFLSDIHLEGNATHVITSPVMAVSGEYLGALVIELSLERTNQALQTATYIMTAISLVMTLLALGLAYFVASLLVKPIIDIKHAAKRITKGDFNTQINSQRGDELGDLSRTIDKMAQSLKTTTVSRDYVDLIIHTMPEGLIILDQQGCIIQVNPYITRLLGKSSEELNGLIFKDICRPINSQQERISNNEECITKYNQVLSAEYEITFNNEHFPVSIAIKEFVSSNGQLESLIVLHDIRQQKILESERQLALEKAEESVQLKSDFLASMSHEIRTPMNGVLGLLRLLLNESLSDQQSRYVTLALSSADTLLTLLNDILDFSKIDADKLSLEEVDFNIGELLGEFSEAMAHLAQKKRLELILDQSGIHQTHVRGDPNRFKQILTNLVGNAIKFTDSGEIVIQISIKEFENGALRCSGKISDTGIGIAQEKIDSLFEAFTQADASTTREYGGTGLGLAIANRLCQKMGNKPIQVDSTLGEGSCFEFYLDFCTSTQSTAVKPNASLDDKLILIVDNNQHSSQAICNQLEYWGAEVTQVDTAKDALQLLTTNIPLADKPLLISSNSKANTSLDIQHNFDMVFIERDMPYMDGCELARAIHENADLIAPPLIIMTSIEPHSGESMAFFKDYGFITSFPKPATLSDLSNASEMALQSSGNVSASPSLNDNVSPNLPETLNLAKTRILLVDDVSINQLIGVSMLEEFECEVDVAENGIEALKALNNATDNNPYQLILMDCQMPKMDGYEATRLIRTNAGGSRHAKVPIIAITANVMQGDKERCLEAGMDDYISKPVDPEILKEKLILWLS